MEVISITQKLMPNHWLQGR